jgi:polyphenol oxidase
MAGTLPSSTEPVLTIPDLTGRPGFVHGFSTVALGSMQRDPAASSPLTPARRAFAAALGLEAGRLTVAGAVHGTAVARVDRPAGVVHGCDALLTDRPGLPLLATFADCYPVLLLDPVRRALAVAHAGWRGAAAGVAAATVQALAREYGSRPDDLLAGLGPGICRRCYAVGEEVAARFPPEVVSREGDRILLDLPGALHAQLVDAGLRAEHVHVHGACTRETPELPSHRRSADGARFACLAALR